MNMSIQQIDSKEIEDGYIEWQIKVLTPVGTNQVIVQALEERIPGSMIGVKTLKSKKKGPKNQSSPIEVKQTFAEFMSDAQTEYYGQIAQIGRDKDFDTYVEDRKTAKYFGFATGHQLVEMWDEMGRPEKFNVVEMGAGNGTYAMNIMTYLQERHADLYNALEYVIVEFSENLRDNQRAKLEDFVGKVRWIEKSVLDVNEDDLADVEGVFLSNELIDALPGHRLKAVNGAWKEIYTVKEGETYRDEIGELASE